MTVPPRVYASGGTGASGALAGTGGRGGGTGRRSASSGNGGRGGGVGNPLRSVDGEDGGVGSPRRVATGDGGGVGSPRRTVEGEGGRGLGSRGLARGAAAAVLLPEEEVVAVVRTLRVLSRVLVWCCVLDDAWTMDASNSAMSTSRSVSAPRSVSMPPSVSSAGLCKPRGVTTHALKTSSQGHGVSHKGASSGLRTNMHVVQGTLERLKDIRHRD